jgi:hypothetical protein
MNQFTKVDYYFLQYNLLVLKVNYGSLAIVIGGHYSLEIAIYLFPCIVLVDSHPLMPPKIIK